MHLASNYAKQFVNACATVVYCSGRFSQFSRTTDLCVRVFHGLKHVASQQSCCLEVTGLANTTLPELEWRTLLGSFY